MALLFYSCACCSLADAVQNGVDQAPCLSKRYRKALYLQAGPLHSACAHKEITGGWPEVSFVLPSRILSEIQSFLL